MKHFLVVSAFIISCLLLLALPTVFSQQMLVSNGIANLTTTTSTSSAPPLANSLPLPLPMLPTLSTPNQTTTVSNAVSTTPSVLQQNLNNLNPNNGYDRPLILPVLINSLVLRPLVSLNEQIAQSMANLPQTFAQNGQALGQAILVPIQQSTATATALVNGLNATLLSLAVNGTLPANAYPQVLLPSIPSPAQVMGQMNAAFNSATMNVLNASTSAAGAGLNGLGNSLSTAGAGVQQLGGGLLSWMASIDRMRTQLAAGNYNITIGGEQVPNALATSLVTPTPSIAPMNELSEVINTTTASSTNIFPRL